MALLCLSTTYLPEKWDFAHYSQELTKLPKRLCKVTSSAFLCLTVGFISAIFAKEVAKERGGRNRPAL